MALILREITREIAINLVSELKNNNGLGKSKEPEDKTTILWQIFLNEIAREVVKQLKESGEEDILKDINIQVDGKDPKEGLDKAEEKLSKIFNKTRVDKKEKEKDIEKIELDDLDDVDLEAIEKLKRKGFRVIYPNLKYRKPKYQNVRELLKYVETNKEKPDGVKLVIMNFND